MSFTYDTKNELLPACRYRSCVCGPGRGLRNFAVLQYLQWPRRSATSRRTPILAARLPKLFRRAFNLQFDRQPER